MTHLHRVRLCAFGLIAGLAGGIPAAAEQPGGRSADDAARIASVTALPSDFSAPEPYETLPGGAATATRPGPAAKAFSYPSANMAMEQGLDFELGSALFAKLWVSAPSSTQASDGLGPLYNARSCLRCHPGNGRGAPPDPATQNTTMGLHLLLPQPQTHPAIADWLSTRPDPVYGRQIQIAALPGIAPEGRVTVSWQEIAVELSEGESASLRKPLWQTEALAYGPLHPEVILSPRMAQQMIGLGLLEAIPEAEILALADPDDADGDGVSGRPNMIWSERLGRPVLGRFGHKAELPSVAHMSALAFSSDIGISSPIFPEGWGDCTQTQTDCRAAPHGGSAIHGGHEISAEGLDLVTFYARNLAVPARRGLDDPQVLRGKEVFHTTGCTACHRPKHVTARLPDRPEQSFQLIWPYSDLLLHDMGEDLADTAPDGVQIAREWRTAPLWGIGRTADVSGHSQFLHDGRARSLLEAILWHGGEAEAARARVTTMPKADRDALIRFLESL